MFVVGSSAQFRISLDRVIARHGTFLVALEVAVCVAAKPEVGWLGHEHAAAHERKGAWHNEAVEKHSAFIHAAVAIGILEHDHVARFLQLAPAVDVRHVAAHFEHPEPAVGIEGDLDRILHERIGRDAFDAKTGLQPEGFQRFLR